MFDSEEWSHGVGGGLGQSCVARKLNLLRSNSILGAPILSIMRMLRARFEDIFLFVLFVDICTVQSSFPRTILAKSRRQKKIQQKICS